MKFLYVVVNVTRLSSICITRGLFPVIGKLSTRTKSKEQPPSKLGSLQNQVQPEVYEIDTVLAQEKKWKVPNATKIKFLRGVYKLSNILVDVLIRIQGEKYVTISLCIGYLKAVKKAVKKCKEITSINEMAKSLEDLLSERFGWMVDVLDAKFDPVYLMAAAFDPNTVHLLSKKDLGLAVTVMQPFVTFCSCCIKQ